MFNSLTRRTYKRKDMEKEITDFEEKADIKIFVSHRIDMDSRIIDNPLYIPVRCGALFDERTDVDLLGDNTGDNISEYRYFLNEYTVMYWAWKNIDADYYGLCHYRRYLNLNNVKTEDSVVDGLGQAIYDSMSDSVISYYGLDDENRVRESIIGNDIIVNREYSIYDITPFTKEKNIRDNWLKYFPQYMTKDSFSRLLDVIKINAPEYYDDAVKYMNKKTFRGFNCFVMKRNLFFDFCEFFFSIIFDFEKSIDRTNRSMTQNREAAYAGEWLYGIWLYHYEKKQKKKVVEREIIAFANTSPKRELKKKNNAIPVIICGASYSYFDIAITMQSIIRNCKDAALDFIILEQSNSLDKWGDYVKDSKKTKILSLADDRENISIRFFDPRHHILDFERNDRYKNGEEVKIYSMLLPWILNEYEKVLYISPKMILNQDICDLFEKSDEYLLYAPINTIFIGNMNGYNPKFSKQILERIDFDYYSFLSTDLMLMNIGKIRERYCQNEVVEMYYRYAKVDEKTIDPLNVDFTINKLWGEQSYVLPPIWNQIVPADIGYYAFAEFVPEKLTCKKDEQKGAFCLANQVFVPIYRNTCLSHIIASIIKETLFEEEYYEYCCGACFGFDSAYKVNRIWNMLQNIAPPNSIRRKIATFCFRK